MSEPNTSVQIATAMTYTSYKAIPISRSSYSYNSKSYKKNILNYDNESSLQRFLSTPFIGNSGKWEPPKVSRRKLIDSGCSDTMISQSTARNMRASESTTSVEFANGTTATSIGTSIVNIAENLAMNATVFEDGILTSDLISVSQIVNENNCDVLFTEEKVSTIDTDLLLTNNTTRRYQYQC